MAARTKRIKDLPKSSRPLEKLIHSGVENLTKDELVALILGTGMKGKNVVSLARQVLKQLETQDISAIQLKGLGITKRARLAATLELGKRLYAAPLIETIRIQTVEDILSQVREIMTKSQEYILVLYINAREELVHKEIVGVGSLNTNVISPREIFRPALHYPCAGIIVSHNHPSGDPSPSDADVAFTTQIQHAGEVMGIPLLDHVIVAKNGYFSFKEGK